MPAYLQSIMSYLYDDLPKRVLKKPFRESLFISKLALYKKRFKLGELP